MLEELADSPPLKRVLEILAGRFGDSVLGSAYLKKELSVRVRAEALIPVLTFLKSDLGFNALNDIIGLDNLHSPAEGGKRFAVLYQLYQFPGKLRLRIYVEADENEPLDSIVPVYKSAEWAEREIFDMFGLRFRGHQGLRRIYMEEEFEGHPLRKDFPLEGTRHGV
jgi:NADH-quinone oxidoreductase subunit C